MEWQQDRLIYKSRELYNDYRLLIGTNYRAYLSIMSLFIHMIPWRAVEWWMKISKFVRRPREYSKILIESRPTEISQLIVRSVSGGRERVLFTYPDIGKNAFERPRFKAFRARNAALEGEAPGTNSQKMSFCALFAQQNAFFVQTYFFLRLVISMLATLHPT